MTRGALITGCYGGIGASLVEVFRAAGWFVIGVDQVIDKTKPQPDHFIQANLEKLCASDNALDEFGGKVRAALAKRPLGALINNAAAQILGGLKELGLDDIKTTMSVNVIAPFLLVRAFLKDLEAAQGAVVNIGSVHAQATKPHFTAYATSKAGLHGLTRALAVELGPKVRVNTLAPAATETEMLKAGFEGDEKAFAALQDVHPLKRIATPEEIARLALFLTSDDAAFMTGATLTADGGVLARLHDPA